MQDRSGTISQGLTGHTDLNGGADGTDGVFALGISGGTGSGGAGTFTVAEGVVTSITITNPGSYSAAPTLSFAASDGLDGASATATIGDISREIMLPGNRRSGYRIQNLHESGALWFREGGTASAGAGSFKLAAGAIFESRLPSEKAVSVFSTTAGLAFSAVEF